MKSLKLHALLASATLLALAASAQAGVNAVDVPRITNGGTGFIGITESAGTPRVAMNTHWRSSAVGVPQQAGEATTMVNGRPNAMPTDNFSTPAMRRSSEMGAAAAPSQWETSPRNDPRYGRGTPD